MNGYENCEHVILVVNCQNETLDVCFSNLQTIKVEKENQLPNFQMNTITL